MIDFFNFFLGIYSIVGGCYTILVSISLREKGEISTLSLIHGFNVGLGLMCMGYLLLSGLVRFTC